MIARVARLSGAHMTYPADAALVSWHDSFLNGLIFHALSRAGISSIKEPAGQSCSDRIRSDGQTLIPWQAGKIAIWESQTL